MNEAKRKYKRKCKTKTITFYLHEGALLEHANKINFSRLVKNALIEDIKKEILKEIKKGGK